MVVGCARCSHADMPLMYSIVAVVARDVLSLASVVVVGR